MTRRLRLPSCDLHWKKGKENENDRETKVTILLSRTLVVYHPLKISGNFGWNFHPGGVCSIYPKKLCNFGWDICTIVKKPKTWNRYMKDTRHATGTRISELPLHNLCFPGKFSTGKNKKSCSIYSPTEIFGNVLQMVCNLCHIVIINLFI